MHTVCACLYVAHTQLLLYLLSCCPFARMPPALMPCSQVLFVLPCLEACSSGAALMPGVAHDTNTFSLLPEFWPSVIILSQDLGVGGSQLCLPCQKLFIM